MENINREIGRRLRIVREISNEGGKLSARQFAYLFDETTDKILNYENGRAAISIQLLINLYNRGFNPVYILTGEGSIFSDNAIGRELASKSGKNDKLKANTQSFKVADKVKSLRSIDEMIEKAHAYNVAAGDILKELSENSGKKL